MEIPVSIVMYASQSSRVRSMSDFPIFKVAVAKHLGLQLLRLADAIVLPFNTTHYAHELSLYLDK